MKRSKGMRLSAVLAAMLLVSMAFVPAVSAGTDQNIAEVSESQARQVAEIYIKKISDQEIPEWDNAIPGDMEIYYDLEDEKLAAYSFIVNKDGLNLGYLIVSAKKSNYPVLEFSKGKSPDKNAEDMRENILKNIKKGQTLGNKRIYYLSGLDYLVLNT